MDKMKSAYEIAMEKAAQIDKEADGGSMEKKEKLKPLLSRYYRDKIDCEELWQELKDEADEEMFRQAQEMLIESLGLRNTEEQFARRKEAIQAIESLKQEQNNSVLAQFLDKIDNLQQQYKKEKEQLQAQIEQQLDQNSQMQMKPVKAKDGRTVMKLQSGVDQETRQKIKKARGQLEDNYNKRFTMLVEKLEKSI